MVAPSLHSLQWEWLRLLAQVSTSRLGWLGSRQTANTPATAITTRTYVAPRKLTAASAIFIRQLRQQQELDGLLYGYEVNEESSVFRYRTGRPMLPDAVSHAFKRIAERAGLHGYHFHNNRDTHATLLLRQGVHPKVVQEMLGHAKVGTTMDIYSHVMPTLQKEAADRFDLAVESAV